MHFYLKFNLISENTKCIQGELKSLTFNSDSKLL